MGAHDFFSGRRLRNKNEVNGDPGMV